MASALPFVSQRRAAGGIEEWIIRRSAPEAGFGRDQATAASGGGVRCSGTNSGGSVGENSTKH